MSKDKRSPFGNVFLGMMILSGLTWVWTVAFIMLWPWQASTTWKPDYRLAATCADGAPCGVPYGELDRARAGGRITALTPPSDNDELMEEENWLRWQKATGKPWQVEATASSWYFQTSVRYRIDGDTPVLVETREIGANTIYSGVGAAMLSLLAIFLMKLRRR